MAMGKQELKILHIFPSGSGYCASTDGKWILTKGDIKIELNSSDAAKLYNALRPSTAPRI